MYGHAKEGSDGRLWLQYGFFYFANDYNLAGGFGLHERDWEMVQLRMDGERPDLAVYAQHAHAETFGVLGTIVGAYFGVRAGAAGRERAEAAREAEAVKVQKLAARMEPGTAETALDKAQERVTAATRGRGRAPTVL